MLELIPEHPTHSICDSSKLSCYLSCPRKYFFRYILGWNSTYPNNHLVFGSAWHAAIERLILQRYNDASLKEAMFIFYTQYRESFPEDTDEMYAPKTVKNALEALTMYYEKYRKEDSHYTPLFTEIAGAVLVSQKRVMHFKIDAIHQDTRDGSIEGMDHKTSSRRMRTWAESWKLSTQMLLYLHVLKSLYKETEVKGIKVRGTFFTKSKLEFEETLIAKRDDQMQAWLTRTNAWLGSLEVDKEILYTEDSPDKPTMDSFPQNDTACFDYAQQCSYFDFCNTWPNPLAHAARVPIGYEVSFWNPLDEPSVKTRIDLTRKDQ